MKVPKIGKNQIDPGEPEYEFSKEEYGSNIYLTQPKEEVEEKTLEIVD